MNENDRSLREHLVKLLDGRQAHVDIDAVIDKLSFDVLSKTINGAPWTLWELFEHLRIAQKDIVEFSRDPEHVSPAWPSGYWPDSKGPANGEEWDESVQAFRGDLEAMKELVQDEATDLHAKIPHGDGQTILREALLVADHNAYHLGQMVLLMKLLGSWNEEKSS